MSADLKDLESAVKAPRENRARKAAPPEPAKKSGPEVPKPPTDKQRRNMQVRQLSRNFQMINDAVASHLDDPYYAVSDEEALVWSESAMDTADYLGFGAVPPPMELLAYTLTIYIPRAFHFWVTGRDRGGPEIDISSADGLRHPAPPPFVDAET